LIDVLNCLLDRWFFVGYYVVLVGLFLHLLGNIITGRIGERYIMGRHKRVTKEEYIPPPARTMHWMHLVSIIGLILTGFLIRYKVLQSYLWVWKSIHYGFAAAVLANLVARFIYAFKGETKTYRDFAFGKRDILTTPAVIRYYLFLQDDHPQVGRFASLQKLTYNIFWILLILQGVMGVTILLPDILLGWIELTVFDSVLLVHIIHVAITWIFIITTTIHVYMALTEGYPLLKLMLLNIEPETGKE